MGSSRRVNIVEDIDGRKIVFIHDIIFYGKQNINWEEVEEYLRRFVGENYEIEDDKEMVYIGHDFPNEYAGSNDTRRLRGSAAKAKANASQGVPEIIASASNNRYAENKAEKHNVDAKFGWYRYHSRVALPVYLNGELNRYNIFLIEVLVRHASSGKKYLYDLVNIKKEAEYPASTEVVR